MASVLLVRRYRNKEDEMTTAGKVLVLAAWVFTQTAHAEIIYSGADQNIVIDQSNPVEKISIAGSDSRWDNLAINLKIWNNPQQKYLQATANLNGNGNQVQTAGVDGLVSRYAPLSTIDASINFNIRPLDFFSYGNDCTDKLSLENGAGNFRNETGYIGLQLSDDGNTYFGWAQVTTENFDNDNARLIIHDWAYNNTPGQAIQAGQTSDAIPESNSMALFMVCAGSFLSFRRIFTI